MPNQKPTDKFSKNIVADLQTNMVMAMMKQGLVKEAKNKLEEFGLPKKEIKKIFKTDQYIKKIKEKNNA